MSSRQLAYRGVPAALIVGYMMACGSGQPGQDDSEQTGGRGPTGTGGREESGGTSNSGGSSSGGAWGASGETSTGGAPSGLLPHETILVEGVTGPFMRPRLLSDSYIYFTTAAQEDQFSTVLTARLWRVPKSGGQAENLTAQDEEGIHAVGADLSHVYFFRDSSTDFDLTLGGWNGWRQLLHRVPLDGTLPAAHQQLSDEAMGTNGWGSMLAQTDELFVATYSESASSFRLWAYEKATGSLVYERGVTDDAGAIDSVRQTGKLAVVHTTANTFFSLDLEDGTSALLGSHPNLCRVIGPDVDGAAWFATCTSTDDIVSVARIEDDGSYEVLVESVWPDELGTSGVFGGKVVHVQEDGDKVYSFDPATSVLETLTLAIAIDDYYPFGVDAQHVYFTSGNTLSRSRYSDEEPVIVEPTCVPLGEPAVCDLLSDEDCVDTPGCTFSPSCSGEGSSCSDFTVGCEYYGCTPGEDEFDPCTGEITCADQGTSTACAGWSCTWNVCVGTAVPCAELSIDDCSTAPHCDLVH